VQEISQRDLITMLDRKRLELAKAAGPDAPEGSRPVLAFDADGTLWQGDVGDDFFEALLDLDGGLVPPVALAGMLEVAMSAGVSIREGANAARALLDAYNANKLDEERFYEIVGWAAAGWRRGEIETFAERVFGLRGLATRMHDEIPAIHEWARKNDVEIFVVSASPHPIVARGVSRLGISAEYVLAAEAEWDGDLMLPKARRPIPYGPGKVQALRSRIGTRQVLAAFGDNVFDMPMMMAASIGVAVRPKPRLLARAHEMPALLKLEH